jgi:hypothetical protein
MIKLALRYALSALATIGFLGGQNEGSVGCCLRPGRLEED